MPRENDKHNNSRGNRDRRSGGKDRSGDRREGGKKFEKRGFAKTGGEKFRPRKPYPASDKASVGHREDRRPRFDGDDRRSGEGGEARAAARFEGRKFADKRAYVPRGEKFRNEGDRHERDRPFAARPRKQRAYGDRGDRGDRSEEKPWQKREPRDRHQGRGFDRPREFGKSRHGGPREARGGDERPRLSRQREDRPFRDASFPERQRFDRSGERSDWHEHPRSEKRSSRHDAKWPRRDNKDEARTFAKRPPFGGRGAYRERNVEEPRPARPPKAKKTGERIAKVLARAGLASRRDAEEWIVQGRVTVNGRVINSPALDVTANDVVTVDGKPLPPRERTRLFLYHKPRGLMTTHADPEGRPTVFDNLPEGLPRLISVGRLDFNTEGLLLLTNDGGLARALELPETGWLRRYRVRAHGEVTQAQLDELKAGIEIGGVKYGPIDATLERDSGANVWLVFAIREGKNREVRNVMAHLGLEVNRLLRISYGPFQLAELAEGAVEEVKTRVLREQLGEKIALLAGADFDRPIHHQTAENSGHDEAAAPRGKKPFRPAGKSGLIADRKGRRVLVQRSGSEEGRARNEAEADGYGPPRRPRRGYHGKRDFKPREE